MITVDRKDITKALKKVASVARVTSHEAPVMGEASEGSLRLWYSSFNLSIWESLDVEEIDEELTFSCPVETLTSLVSSWSSDTVTLESGDNNTLIIRSGRSNVTVPYYEGIFDDIEELPDTESVAELSGDILSNLEVAQRFTARTEDRPTLTCVLFQTTPPDRIEIIASDAFHFYHRVFTGPVNEGDSRQLLIPNKNADFLKKLFGVRDTLIMEQADNDYILFRGPTSDVLSAVFNEEYPDVSSIIEDAGTELFTFRRDVLLDIISIGDVLSDNAVLELTQEGDSVLASFPRNVSESELYLDDVKMVLGLKKPIYLDITFLRQCLEVLDSERLSFSEMESGSIRLVGDDPTVSTMMNVLRY